MRYYVMSVEHNSEKDAENRTVPKAFDDIDSAKKQFHSVLASDINNPSLDWAMAIILNQHGGTEKVEYWEKYVEPVIEEPVVEEPTVEELRQMIESLNAQLNEKLSQTTALDEEEEVKTEESEE